MKSKWKIFKNFNHWTAIKDAGIFWIIYDTPTFEEMVKLLAL